MLDVSHDALKVVGLKQSRKAVRDGAALRAFVALDAEERIRAPFVELCREYGVDVTDAPTMEELGEAFGISIGAAVAVILRG